MKVISSNGGMPCLNCLSDNTHIYFEDFNQVKYPYLADIFDGHWFIFSIGDFICLIGMIGLFYNGI